ncbi:ribonuclease Y [Candidatus Parcubacteria bacterium]|nr:ribonuclease Y [Candidatus Parcubacteria bacterium]
MEQYFILAAAVAGLFGGAVAGYFARQTIAKKQAGSIEAKLTKLVEDAKTEARETLLKAKDKSVKIVEEAQREAKEREHALERHEERILKREELLEHRLAGAEKAGAELAEKIERVRAVREEVEAARAKADAKLAEVAKLTEAEAKQEIMRLAETKSSEALGRHLQKLEQGNLDAVEARAREIMATAIQRYSRTHVADITTSVVALPDDEMKGRIIGREGRNIKALERLTGVDIIVDDTPGAITLSSFDPIRREVAKMAVAKLVADGRIQPARIEEKVEEARAEMKKKIQEAGEAAVYETGILDFPQPLVQLLGRLAFRVSYGQNVLLHSIEAAHLATMIAKELGADEEVAKRAALLHDIGKAIDHEVEGSHLELGRKILSKYSVAEPVIQAMEAHHEDYPFRTPEALIVAAAEAISAARPGARRDTVENYIKRLEELEKVATSFEGVEKVYAIQAGREVRVFVTPEKVDDYAAMKLARDIADRIEEELRYPGEIKVNVIRELRAVEYAK